MTLRKILLAGTAFCAAAVVAAPAFAATDAATKAEIEALKQQVMELSDRLQTLQDKTGEQLTDIRGDSSFSIKGGKPVFKTRDGNFELAIRGRAHFDVATASRDGTLTPYNNGANFRRAELGVEGTFMKDWGYVLGLQFGGSGTDGASTVKEAYISYNGIPGLSIQGGAIGVPLTLEYATSSNDITFIERSAAVNSMIALGSDDSRTAFGARYTTPNLFGMVYYTKSKVGDNATTHSESDNVVGRVAWALDPTASDALNVHLGFSATYSPHFFAAPSLGDRPGVRVDDLRYINTGGIANVDSATYYGPEVAFNYGPFRVQGEWYKYDYSRKLGSPDVDFSAWYAQASWVLTGEAYKYSMDGAAFKGVKPDCPVGSGGWGAWELAVRYSNADFTDLTTGINIRGGKEEMVTAGLNWYPIDNIRFMFNYIHAKESEFGPLGVGNLDIFALRTQYAF